MTTEMRPAPMNVEEAAREAPRKQLEQAWGFDDVAIVPGAVTTNPEIVGTGLTLGERSFELPILASAMDAVVSPSFASALSRAGGLAVLNLEGVQTRYDDPDEVLARIAAATPEESTAVIQRAYEPPLRDELVGRRIEEIRASGGVAAVSATPQNTILSVYVKGRLPIHIDVFRRRTAQGDFNTH